MVLKLKLLPLVMQIDFLTNHSSSLIIFGLLTFSLIATFASHHLFCKSPSILLGIYLDYMAYTKLNPDVCLFISLPC